MRKEPLQNNAQEQGKGRQEQEEGEERERRAEERAGVQGGWAGVCAGEAQIEITTNVEIELGIRILTSSEFCIHKT